MNNEVMNEVLGHDLPIMIIVMSSLMAIGFFLMVAVGIYYDIKRRIKRKD